MNRYLKMTLFLPALVLCNCGDSSTLPQSVGSQRENENSSSNNNPTGNKNPTGNNNQAGNGSQNSNQPGQIDTVFDYREITGEEIESVELTWENRDLSPKDVAVVRSEQHNEMQVDIVRHRVSNRTHYGAILTPLDESSSPRPIVIVASGLNQALKRKSVEHFAEQYGNTSPFADFIKIIPLFRGQIFDFSSGVYPADGDFCDAYAGAADDAIAFLNVAETLLPSQARFDKVLVNGGSRGGNTGLLLAMRDERINTVIAAAAPVDFYRNDIRLLYGSQYDCQFLAGRTEDASRRRMLTSSPLFFQPNALLQNVFLFHGERDWIVPVRNANEMYQHLMSFSVDVSLTLYAGHDHGSFYSLSEHQQNLSRAIRQFKNNLEM